MIYISRLKLRNFKSFKNLNVELPSNIICFAGPNGSGKSNVCDSIRFVLGETSLRSLRAKKVRDLIHIDSKTAEVTLTFDGEAKYDIKRAIRDDGKIIYRLNGKKTTRTALLELLKKYNLDSSGRNIIAQGEVQRIASISGKERREIIDSVAGISDYEAKKKEALSELAVVDGRINEANIVLGERIAFLDELGKERNTALRYKDAKERLDSARAALIRSEIARYEKELERYEKQKRALNERTKTAEEQLKSIQAKIAKTEEERFEISKELQKKQKSTEEIRRIEELKARIASLRQTTSEKKELAIRLSKEQARLEKELNEENERMEKIAGELKEMEKELLNTEPLLIEENVDIGKAAELRRKKEKIEGELQELREKNAAREAETKGKKEQVEMLRRQLREFCESCETENAEREISEKIQELEREKKNIENEIDALFEETREINKRIAELEKSMLELKERASVYRVRTSPHLLNPALKYINDLKEKEKGIYGTVADLIKFEPALAKAIEAAGGGRLLYVVVDNSDRAVKIIDKLKKERLGRATFIPLDTINPQVAKPVNGFEPLLKRITFSEEVKRAVEYVFGDAILINSHADAKKVGIGRVRMVTLDGETYERSGTITGGHTETGILAQRQLERVEEEFLSVKKEKEALTSRLYAIREEESELRAKRSRIEIEIKTLQSEITTKIKELEEAGKRKKELENQISAIEKMIEKAEAEQRETTAAIERVSKNIENITNELIAAEKEEKESRERASKRATELTEKVSSLRATIEGRRREIEIIRETSNGKRRSLEEVIRDYRTVNEEIKNGLDEEAKRVKELEAEEERMRAKGKEIEELFETMSNLEKELQTLGGAQEKTRREIADIGKELGQVDLKSVSATTRLEDLKLELEKYKEVKPLEEGSRQNLSDIIAECERTLNEIGSNVNLAAIEMYQKKEEEINEVKRKINQLSEERNAILKMIDEIEERKKEAFFDAYNKISDNFKKMFAHINIGQGYLVLDKPNEPFDSGLYIRIKKGDHEYSLDSLSGGETTLVSLMFVFALQFFKPAPFYILDEVDAALDKENSRRMIKLIKEMSKDSQFMIVSHNDTVISNADVVFGVTKVGDASKLVGVKLGKDSSLAPPAPPAEPPISSPEVEQQLSRPPS
ncbi:MAG: chromosome segregation SMC family protein [Candidatus Bilamarchaeaceae archaeon]